MNRGLSVYSFKSKNSVISNQSQPLNIYLINTCSYENSNLLDSDNIYQVSTEDFIKKRDNNVILRYQEVLSLTYSKPSSQMKVF